MTVLYRCSAQLRHMVVIKEIRLVFSPCFFVAKVHEKALFSGFMLSATLYEHASPSMNILIHVWRHRCVKKLPVGIFHHFPFSEVGSDIELG